MTRQKLKWHAQQGAVKAPIWIVLPKSSTTYEVLQQCDHCLCKKHVKNHSVSVCVCACVCVWGVVFFLGEKV